MSDDVVHPSSHDIGTRLYRARVAAGLSRPELARLAGVSAYAIADIECDRKHTYPSGLTMAGVARALGTTMDALWWGDDDEITTA